MTQEQKDWLEYGKLKFAWKYTKQVEPKSSRILIPLVLEARRKAHRWFNRGECKYCKHSCEDWNRETWANACYTCLYNDEIYPESIESDNWEPREEMGK